MVELFKGEGDDEDAILESGGGYIEDCQDGGQVSKVSLGNPAGEEQFSYHSDQSLPSRYEFVWCRALSSVICVNSKYCGHSSMTLLYPLNALEPVTTLPLSHGAEKKENHTTIQSTGHSSLPKLLHAVRSPLP